MLQLGLDGNIIFDNCLKYSAGILEFVNGKDPSFYSTKEIPIQLREIGAKLVDLFKIKKKFFHFEFFNTENGIIPLEVNCRPPGGPIIDMMNYSSDIDLYDLYAKMILGLNVSLDKSSKKYFCGYVGRNDRGYIFDDNYLLTKYKNKIIEFKQNPPLFQEAMGINRYIFRDIKEENILEMMHVMLELGI